VGELLINNEGMLLVISKMFFNLNSGLTALPEAPISGHQYRWSSDGF
jgi:hypothetical protein